MIKDVQKLLDVIKMELGTKEGKNNDNKYGRELGMNHVAYCVLFGTWAFKHAGYPELFCKGARMASCTEVMNWAKKNECWVTKDYRPGDCLILDFDDPNTRDKRHFAICTGIKDEKTVLTIEANTGSASQDDGDGVWAKSRPTRLILGAYRPDFDVYLEDDMKVFKTYKDVPSYHQPTVKKLMDKGALKGDEKGNLNITEDMCRIFTVLDRLGKL